MLDRRIRLVPALAFALTLVAAFALAHAAVAADQADNAAVKGTWKITMDYQGDPPWLDLDNLAKAILDACKGYAFHDDSQVARLLVQRRAGERERITVRITQANPAE